MTWGYAHLTLDGDRATVRIYSTPDDGSGSNKLEITQTFARRSGASQP
jgi:hypothetical protein